MHKGSTIVGHVPRRISAMCYTFLGDSGCSITCKVTGHRRYSRDLPQGGMEVPCHLIFHGEEIDIQKIRSLIAVLNTAQLIASIKIVDGYSEEEIAEITKGVINENPVKVENSETYSSKNSGDALDINDPQASPIKIGDPENYSSNKSGGNDTNSITGCVRATDQPQTSVESIRFPNTTMSPFELVQEVLRSPESSEESVIVVDRDSTTSYVHGAACKSKDVSVSKFYGVKTNAKEDYLDSDIRRKKSCDVQWVKLGKSCLSKFDREEIDSGSRLNDRHINHAQAMIKSQFSLEGLQCTLFQNSRQPPRNDVQIIHSRGNHWIVVSSLLSERGHVNVYDSLYDSVDEDTLKSIKFLFKDDSIKVKMSEVQKQCGGNDCGLFAIANAVQLAKRCDPTLVKYHQYQMRAHLINCFAKSKMTTFPSQRSKK